MTPRAASRASPQPLEDDLADATLFSVGVKESAVSNAASSQEFSDRTVGAIRASLDGRRRFNPLLFAGPAVIASIA
jgi:hypothetical protein